MVQLSMFDIVPQGTEVKTAEGENGVSDCEPYHFPVSERKWIDKKILICGKCGKVLRDLDQERLAREKNQVENRTDGINVLIMRENA